MLRARRDKKRSNPNPSKGKKATPKGKDDQPWRLVCIQDAVPSTSEKEEGGRQDSLGDAHWQRLVLNKKCDKRWKKEVINVYLCTTGSNYHDIILQYASEWSKHCAIQFKKCDNIDESDIRVSFEDNNDNKSLVGTDAKKCDRNSTMNLAVVHCQNRLPKDKFKKELRRTILHEFGHVLGLEHEHQSPNIRFKWNEKGIIGHCLNQQGWDEATTRLNILNQLTVADVHATEWDEKSIMHYGFGSEFLLTLDDQPFHEIYDNYDLSELDIKAIGEMYPRSDREPVGGETSVLPLPTNPPGGQQVTTAVRKRPAATSGTTDSKKAIPSPGLDLAGRPSTEDLEKISCATGRKRNKLLRSLGIEEATIETLYDNYPNHVEEACYQGLLIWENEEALTPVTWGTLIDALKKAKLTKLANELLHKGKVPLS